jgi:hypothetical protein
MLLFFVSGCTQFLQPSTDASVFVGGTKGVELRFVENAPPSKMLNTDIFDIAVFANNEGEYDLDEGDITFTLGNSRTFGIDVSNQTNVDPLMGVDRVGESVVPGGFTAVFYENAQYAGPRIITEQAQIPISVTAFYPYETDVISRLCVSKSSTDVVCDYPGGEGSIKPLHSSGAPVQISEIKQITSVYSPESETVSMAFTIKLDNVGGGDIYDITTVPNNLTAKNVNWVEFSELSFGTDVWDLVKESRVAESGAILDCGTQNKYYVDERGAQINCQLRNVPAPSDYEDILNVKLRYKYSTTVAKTVSFITFET